MDRSERGVRACSRPASPTSTTRHPKLCLESFQARGLVLYHERQSLDRNANAGRDVVPVVNSERQIPEVHRFIHLRDPGGGGHDTRWTARDDRLPEMPQIVAPRDSTNESLNTGRNLRLKALGTKHTHATPRRRDQGTEPVDENASILGLVNDFILDD